VPNLFLKTLKRELEEVAGNTSRKKARLAVFEYIEAYYNRSRIHSRKGFKPPIMMLGRVA